MIRGKLITLGAWRNGSASDSRSEGWVFESLRPHTFYFYFFHNYKIIIKTIGLSNIIKVDKWLFFKISKLLAYITLGACILYGTERKMTAEIF